MFITLVTTTKTKSSFMCITVMVLKLIMPIKIWKLYAHSVTTVVLCMAICGYNQPKRLELSCEELSKK